MMLFARPALPAEFTNRVQAMLAGRTKERDIWRNYKQKFQEAQHERCGYCDFRLDKSSYPDVDHYRPHGQLDELHDPEAEAKCSDEIPPKTRRLSDKGYEWLKYEWTNFVYACKGCNEAFKRCLFPVKNGTRAMPLDPSICAKEEELLLWCYGKGNEGQDPVEHLEFTRTGAIAAKNASAHGLATIFTCGLSRRFLRDHRAEKLEKAAEVLAQLEEARAENDAAAFADCIEKLRRRGAVDQHFAGVFRIFVMNELGATTWDDVLALRL